MTSRTATRYAKRLDKLVAERNAVMSRLTGAWPGLLELRQWPLRSERDFFAELAVELRRLAAKPKKRQSKVRA